MSQNVDEFVKEMEEDILDDEQLNEIIKDEIAKEPPKPVKKQTVYQEQYRKPQRKQTEQVLPPHYEQYREHFEQMERLNNGYSLEKFKRMINFNKLKLPIFTMVLFFVLSLSQVNDILGSYVTLFKLGEDGKPTFINLAVKGILFGLIVLVMSQLL
jgi:hypothetical protein